ncbi:MAG: ABC transporter ATP-binding protein [Candidatus Thalassarchaeaceae archaeon]|jgi:ABC-2 type transport system ATP-binding protein|nr:ABC transporter [Actinomycetota bacterium]MDP6220332.1 ABC transporter ATP-binding protein [Candidatus Thalassarchaeaceae archaeon]MDP7091363.1 ABC transporter ATP-binding protein [Candidatus Thalassarchaeaceae archaeon]MDP7256547.1 ABC transporter ATP-binding protein [Candidatus Thalassarchaeaceae archaeon]MDP7648676.1 ABC transporter ATP-binding protein [Candidatus Thalassarchaeaceae archaeon]|tara:strand:- start:2868 stop:3854 length:987 start_codon:yes stop_codon:yes gene_type:complete
MLDEDTNPVITTKALRKMYGPHLALDDVTFEIPHGAIGILGPNGAGKSTLFKCLLGLIGTTSGEGTVLGYDIRAQADLIRSKIGYMPEYNALDPGLFAVDQVRYAGELLGMNSSTATQRAHEVLEYVGLKDQRYRQIETFSTGMLQATKLACALVHDPEILICDEPTNGLDQRARKFMLQTLRRTVEEGNRTVLMSSHVMDDVQEVCDRIVLIHKGRIVVQRSIDDLVSQVEREIEIMVWGGASKMEQELASRGLSLRRLGRVIRIKVEDDTTIQKVLEAAVSADVQVRQMREYEPDLEDVFLLIMDKLGSQIKGTSDLMTPEHTGGA